MSVPKHIQMIVIVFMLIVLIKLVDICVNVKKVFMVMAFPVQVSKGYIEA